MVYMALIHLTGYISLEVSSIPSLQKRSNQLDLVSTLPLLLGRVDMPAREYPGSMEGGGGCTPVLQREQ